MKDLFQTSQQIKLCKRRAQVFMTDFLQNELHECNGKLAEINRMYSLL